MTELSRTGRSGPSLAEQLQEQRDKKQAEWEAQHSFSA